MENQITEIKTVPLETANYLLGQILAISQINKHLNESIKGLKNRIDVQSLNILSYERNNEKLENEIRDLKSKLKAEKQKGAEK